MTGPAGRREGPPYAPGVSSYSAQGTRLNRRGLETRQTILDVAVRCLTAGGAEVVSANLIAREAGVTWGTIQHQFGDSDGVWAAVLDHVTYLLERNPPGRAPARPGSLAKQVEVLVDWMWTAYSSPPARAVQTLRTVLPRERDALTRDFPRTAAAMQRTDEAWTAAFAERLDGLVASKTKLRRVRVMLPPAVRGIHQLQESSSLTDAEEAKRALIDAVVAYLGT